MKYIFLFGAGASRGCGGTNFESPIGSDLYLKLREKDYIWNKNYISPIVPEDFRNFEQGMEKLYYHNFNYGNIFSSYMKSLAEYFFYLKIIKDEQNLYCLLLNNFQKKEVLNNVLFSTLNYDTLLEQACDKMSLSYDYFHKNKILICKLHGSCNFLPSPRFNRCQFRMDIKIGTNIIKYDQLTVEMINNNDLSPGMAIYMKGKPIQVGEQMLINIQKNWNQEVVNAKKIFLIGVGLNIEDNHIWEPLKETSAQIIYCSGKNSGKEYAEWAKKNRSNKNDIIINKYFKEGFEEICSYIN